MAEGLLLTIPQLQALLRPASDTHPKAEFGLKSPAAHEVTPVTAPNQTEIIRPQRQNVGKNESGFINRDVVLSLQHLIVELREKPHVALTRPHGFSRGRNRIDQEANDLALVECVFGVPALACKSLKNPVADAHGTARKHDLRL
ncbi:hypothetical protein [Microvirga yunnanensis]|uniref:hypothetical protein n=1 Tax=Microvirga yunnanensis TaxID=2953740 RepID=UPI0021C8E241|nr:hypothetical protein [Microvirga sp. HBU65207]